MQFDRENELTSQSIKDFIDYFEGKVKVTSRNKDTYEKEVKLEKLMNVYESDMSSIKKLDEITKIYKNSTKLRSAYTKLRKYHDDEFIKKYYDKIEQIANYLEKAEEAGLVEISKDLVAQEQYIEDYPYAKEYMERYLRSKKIFKKEILDEVGVTEPSFDYLKGIIEDYDKVLSIYYREKVNADRRERRYKTRKNFLEMYKGITTGKTRYGDEFTPLDCYILLPFKNADNANELLSDFGLAKGSNIDIKTKNLLNGVVPEEANTIIKYFIDNKLFFGNCNFMTEKDIRNTKMSINDRVVTDEDKENIIRFMNYHEIPYAPKAFNMVRDLQLEGKLYPKEKTLSKTK